MKQLLFFSFLYLFSAGKLAGQCSVIIHQTGSPTDTLFIANDEDHQPQRINDSTYILLWNTSTPERICLVLDRSTRWWTSIWIEPGIKKKEIIIDYSNKEMRLIHGSKWDSISQKWMGKFPYRGDAQTDSVAVLFVEKNPDSYLSLFFLSHGVYRDNPEKKRAALAKLNSTFSAYPEFKQALASLNERKYPKPGDGFKEFTLADINGDLFNTNSIGNKWILLNLWSNSCGPCVKEIDDFIKLYNSVDSSKIKFISVALDEDRSKWKLAKPTNKIPWTNLWTPDNVYCELCLNYNLFSMPFFILFDSDKKLFYIKDGAGELENMKNTFKEKGLLK
jgi:thiol-disulfide isomerase/thioredoxin